MLQAVPQNNLQHVFNKKYNRSLISKLEELKTTLCICLLSDIFHILSVQNIITIP